MAKKKKKKGKMPPALKAYWDRRRGKRRATRKKGAKRRGFVVVARKGAREMYYMGGHKMGSRAYAKVFASRLDADAIAYLLREAYPMLKSYSVGVTVA